MSWWVRQTKGCLHFFYIYKGVKTEKTPRVGSADGLLRRQISPRDDQHNKRALRQADRRPTVGASPSFAGAECSRIVR